MKPKDPLSNESLNLPCTWSTFNFEDFYFDVFLALLSSMLQCLAAAVEININM
jgi:hypothetical protein